MRIEGLLFVHENLLNVCNKLSFFLCRDFRRSYYLFFVHYIHVIVSNTCRLLTVNLICDPEGEPGPVQYVSKRFSYLSYLSTFLFNGPACTSDVFFALNI
jgi:hypothetical protein